MKGRNEFYMKLVAQITEVGYELKRTKGSHFIYSNGRRTISLNKDLNHMVYKRLLKECGLQEV